MLKVGILILLEVIIETFAWILAIILFYLFGIKVNLRIAIIGFLFMQAITWPSGYIVTEMNLISYPVRFFDYASKSSFTFEYLVFPVVSGLFSVYYPKKSSKLKKITYTFVIVSTLTIAEIILERYTDTVEYLNWTWYLSFITMFISLHVSNFLSYWLVKKFK